MTKPVIRTRGVRFPVPKGTVLARSDAGSGPLTIHTLGKNISIDKKKRINANLLLKGDVITDTNGNATVVGLENVPLDFSAKADTFVLAYSASGSKIIFAAPGGGGGGDTDTFITLTDCPASYAGAALKGVRVNAGATGLEFYTPAGDTDTFTGLTDAPASYTGQSLKAVRVNVGETALEFYTPSGGGGSGYPAGSPPTVVQSAVDNTGGASITLPNPPTNGNLLICMYFNPTVTGQGTGWTFEAGNSSGTDYGNILSKVAGAGESATQTPLPSSPGGTGVIMMWEINGQSADHYVMQTAFQPETSGFLGTPLPLQIFQGTLFLGAVAVVASANITKTYNLGNQDALIASSGNRRIVAGHATLADLPYGGIFVRCNVNAATKGCSCIIG